MDSEQPFPCFIARKVGRGEFASEPNAIEAMDKEWKKLDTTKRPDPKDKGIECLDISEIRGEPSVRDEARRTGTKVHFGRIAELCMEREVNCQKARTPQIQRASRFLGG